jgi:hypothetical protein
MQDEDGVTCDARHLALDGIVIHGPALFRKLIPEGIKRCRSAREMGWGEATTGASRNTSDAAQVCGLPVCCVGAGQEVESEEKGRGDGGKMITRAEKRTVRDQLGL